MPVRNAGSKRLAVVTTTLPARLVVAVNLEDAGSIPAGTFLTSTEPASDEQGVENALVNPARVLSRDLGSSLPTEYEIADGADYFLNQFRVLLDNARRTLQLFSHDSMARADLVDAGVALDALSHWVLQKMVARSGGDATAPLQVPQSVADRAMALVRLGQRLRQHWKQDEVTAKARPTAENPAPASTQQVGQPASQQIQPLPVAEDHKPNLTPQEIEMLRVFLDAPLPVCLTADAICEKAFMRCKDHGRMDGSDFRSRIVPRLRPWGLQSEGKRGYSLSPDAPARRVLNAGG